MNYLCIVRTFVGTGGLLLVAIRQFQILDLIFIPYILLVIIYVHQHLHITELKVGHRFVPLTCVGDQSPSSGRFQVRRSIKILKS